MRPLRRDPATTLQLNIGLYCNQACSHCHVESSPLRKEMMDRQTAARCITLLKASQGSVRTLDLTGGAPELNSEFRCAFPPLSNALRATCMSWSSKTQGPGAEVWLILDQTAVAPELTLQFTCWFLPGAKLLVLLVCRDQAGRKVLVLKCGTMASREALWML